MKEKKQFIPMGSKVYVAKDGKVKQGNVVRVKKNLFGQLNFQVKDGSGKIEQFGRNRVSKSKPRGVDYV